MKHILKYLFAFVIFMGTSMHAQEVNTLYFMHNAPMRHTINPSFQPESNVYVLLPMIGYTSLGLGNNAITMKDLIFKDPTTGKTITALHPDAEGILWNKLPQNMNINTNLHLNILSFGARVSKQKGYFHVNISERIGMGIELPKSTFGPLLGQGLNNINLNSLNTSISAYTEVAVGYSHIINEQWTVGGKLKVLLGHTYVRGYFNELNMTSTQEATRLYGDGRFQVAGIVNSQLLEGLMSGEGIPNNYIDQLLNDLKSPGLGGAIDLGMTYKPWEYLHVTASVTDLGFIHWKKGEQAVIAMDTTFTGLGDMKYENYTDQNGTFQTDAFINDATENLTSYLDALHIQDPTQKPFTQMITANLNIGVEGNFWKDRLGIGVYSRTRFYNSQIAEEITFGAAFRPFKCFNLAASYSVFNGHSSNIGAAISIAPYDGIMLTLASDYIPLTFAGYNIDGQVISLPYQTGYVNIALGFAIVVGTCKKNNY